MLREVQLSISKTRSEVYLVSSLPGVLLTRMPRNPRTQRHCHGADPTGDGAKARLSDVRHKTNDTILFCISYKRLPPHVLQS